MLTTGCVQLVEIKVSRYADVEKLLNSTNLKFVGSLPCQLESGHPYQGIVTFRTLGTTLKMLAEKCGLHHPRGLS